ncbi:60S ribosomal protein L10A [Anaeramoeba ignava]|uniref:60S ribosomal protein L10A n=1 Tax=Anaeramoeba ignava TaxID=1746090 RepID=A0A9Q0RGV1_ANAIG|nr:60S ribosomal protein L10A [Anaeramoeba ignava]
MSKLNTTNLDQALNQIYNYLSEKKRKFTETFELQITLKNYDIQKDKRFSEFVKLPHIIKPKMKICVIGDETHCEEAKNLSIPFVDIGTISSFSGNDKLAKQWSKRYDGFLASDKLLKKVTRTVGSLLNKLGKFPKIITHEDSLEDKILEMKQTIHFQLKKALNLNTAIGTTELSKQELKENIVSALDFLVSLLKKRWQNIDKVYLKSTMSPSFQLF